MITTLRQSGPNWAMSIRCFGKWHRAAMPATTPYQQAHHALLIHSFARKADRFVASAMELQRGRTVDATVARATETCAALVLGLDNVGTSWDNERAAREIRATAPALTYLVGKPTSSHYNTRRAECDELQELARYVATWVIDGGPPTSFA